MQTSPIQHRTWTQDNTAEQNVLRKTLRVGENNSGSKVFTTWANKCLVVEHARKGTF